MFKNIVYTFMCASLIFLLGAKESWSSKVARCLPRKITYTFKPENMPGNIVEIIIENLGDKVCNQKTNLNFKYNISVVVNKSVYHVPKSCISDIKFEIARVELYMDYVGVGAYFLGIPNSFGRSSWQAIYLLDGKFDC